MASSVSIERAFSSSSITVTKRRNRLKHDLVEALQILKCSLRSDLFYTAHGPTSQEEQDIEAEDIAAAAGLGDDLPETDKNKRAVILEEDLDELLDLMIRPGEASDSESESDDGNLNEQIYDVRDFLTL